MNLERTTKPSGPEFRRCDYGIYISLGRALGDTDMQVVSSQASPKRSLLSWMYIQHLRPDVEVRYQTDFHHV